MLPLCLIVSADPAYVSALQRGLKDQRVKLHGVPDLAAVRPMLAQWRLDAVLCDADGSTAGELEGTVRSLRREQRAPIVVLATAANEEGLLAFLEAGATELIDRAASPRLIGLQLRRLVDLAADGGDDGADDPPRAVSLGGLRLDPRRAEAVFGDRPLPLTGGEFELLLLLAARADGFVHRDTIMRTLGRPSAAGESRRCADMHVCRIRKKLREAGAASTLELETIYGRGYALRLRGEAIRPG